MIAFICLKNRKERFYMFGSCCVFSKINKKIKATKTTNEFFCTKLQNCNRSIPHALPLLE